MPAPPMSDTTTRGIRVGATAHHLPHESDPAAGDYRFGYRVVILNNGDRPAQLLQRRWEIVDADGASRCVTGDGVVGQTPWLEPGQAFKYTSTARLKTPWGTMEGHYVFEDESGNTFEVEIGRFWLTPEAQAVADPAGTAG